MYRKNARLKVGFKITKFTVLNILIKEGKRSPNHNQDLTYTSSFVIKLSALFECYNHYANAEI